MRYDLVRKDIILGIIILFVGASVSVINAYENYQYNLEKNSATITFLNSEDGCIGTIIFDEKEYSLPVTIVTNIGNHSLRIGALIIGCNLVKWETSGDIIIENPESYNTTVYVNGNGTITINSYYDVINKSASNLFHYWFLERFPLLERLLSLIRVI